MRFTLFLLLILSPPIYIHAQCRADAGDTVFSCASDSIASVLGGALTASGGISPYQFTWRIEPVQWFPGSPLIFHASDILDDTTKANPTIISPGIDDSIVFYVQIKDSLGCIAQDSCLVIYSSFIHSLGNYYYNIDKGDSVYLNRGANVSGGIGTLSYRWKPTHGLSDSSKLSGFWAKPDSSIKYRVTVTDEISCEETGAPYYFIYVNHIGLEDNSSLSQVDIYPNPVDERIYIKGLSESKEITVEILGLSGQVVLRQKGLKSNNVVLRGLNPGVYMIKISGQNGRVYKRILKE